MDSLKVGESIRGDKFVFWEAIGANFRHISLGKKDCISMAIGVRKGHIS